ncbi:MAG: flagellar motor switch protein FliN [Treponema sp.]|nr:flagellar motor switch protein FliN [Treponema sp.]
MSDGALSQAEIDALLAGVDSGGGGGAATAVASSSFSQTEQTALIDFFNATLDAQSANLSKMTGAEVSLKDPQLTINGRDVFLEQLSETVTVVKADFNSGFPGEHLFLIPEDGAKAIASLMNKEENIELDEMAMSVIGEVVSQMVGHQITTLTNKTGNKSISSVSPDVSNVPRAVVALPSGDFAGITYQLDLGDGKNFSMWEVLGPSAALEIARALSGGGQQKQAGGAAAGIGGMNMGGMQMGMGGMGMGGGGMSLGPSNVQSVQFPNLMPHGGPQEAGNIGLIMDVYMEMTVELGRTRKLIKEILAMGEGTIIELDKLAGEPVDILVNHKLIAKGEVVVIDENFGVRVTEIVSPMERMSNMD